MERFIGEEAAQLPHEDGSEIGGAAFAAGQLIRLAASAAGEADALLRAVGREQILIEEEAEAGVD